MTQTPHGLNAADDFLLYQLQKDLGVVQVTVAERTWDETYFDVFISPQARPDHKIQLPQVTWTPNGRTADEFGEHTAIIESVRSEQPQKQRRIFMMISGLENIPDVYVPKFDELYCSMYSWDNGGFYPKDHPVVMEFNRRWSIESAAKREKAAREQIQRLLAEGPHMNIEEAAV